MKCTALKLPGGVNAIVCGRSRVLRCRCGAIATLECDWKMDAGKTCDAGICAECTVSPTPGKDLCVAHVDDWRRWKERRETPRS